MKCILLLPRRRINAVLNGLNTGLVRLRLSVVVAFVGAWVGLCALLALYTLACRS